MTLRVAISGFSGRMGAALQEAIAAASNWTLVGALDTAASVARAQPLTAPQRVQPTSVCSEALEHAQVLIDFSQPEATVEYARYCREHAIAMVIGTTGFDEAQKEWLSECARVVPIVMAPNMSVGVNVTFKLIELAARTLGADFDIEVIETHHRHKRDAPSGTALRMGEIAAGARETSLKHAAVYQRHDAVGERTPGTIGFSAIRGGDVVGDHTVLFAGSGERIEITHRAASRATYAQGSLRAAQYVVGRSPGLYDMQDVLGLRTP